jgi:hypothetical protein
MKTVDLLYDGHATAPLAARTLNAGPLTLLYDEGDIRRVRLGAREIIRRIYFALRDRNWDTVPTVRRNERIEAGADWFRIRYEAECRQGAVAFTLAVRIDGAPDGVLTFSFEGAAQSDYLHSRTGFCLLHPVAECAGQICRITRVDGSVVEGVFPVRIRPEQPVEPFSDMAALRYDVAPGVAAEIAFSGDLFEMEDQRNWTDASYKTFCTPLRLGYPRPIQQGERVCQSIVVRITGDPSALLDPSSGSERAGALRWDGQPAVRLPWLGLGLPAGARPLSVDAAERLAALRLDHLRVDLDLASDTWLQALETACAAAEAIDAALEVALFCPAHAPLEMLRAAFERLRPIVTRWLVFDSDALVTTHTTVRAARAALVDYAPDAAIAGGSKADLYELNAAPPALDALDAVVFGLNPQTHAFDNLSLIETLEAQPAAVETARAVGLARPVVVSPVTLKPRFNPYATEQPTAMPDELPAEVDSRQASLLGAGWTLASIGQLAAAGAAAATYYETIGWRGVMEAAEGSPLPDRFPSTPGGVFPLYHVFAGLADFAGGECFLPVSSDPLRFQALLLRKNGRERLLLANLTRQPQTVSLAQWTAPAHVRILDETSVELAMTAPETFRNAAGATLAPTSAGLVLSLPPYAVAFADAIGSSQTLQEGQEET